jgi:hypothetical protein
MMKIDFSAFSMAFGIIFWKQEVKICKNEFVILMVEVKRVPALHFIYVPPSTTQDCVGWGILLLIKAVLTLTLIYQELYVRIYINQMRYSFKSKYCQGVKV